MEDLEESLYHARKCFMSGKLHLCRSILSAISVFALNLENSNIFDCVRDNNIILCDNSEMKKSSSQVTSDASGKAPRSVEDLKLILQKLKGLPASRRLCTLELVVTYNEAMLTLVGGAQDMTDVKRKIGELETNAINCLQRYISTFEDKMDYDKDMSVVDQLEMIKHFDVEPDTALSMTLVSCALSVYYLMDGAPRKARQLLSISYDSDDLGDDPFTSLTFKQKKKSGFSLLMKLPGQNIEVRSTERGRLYSKLSILVDLEILLRAYCFFCEEDYTKCLEMIQIPDDMPELDDFTPAHIRPVVVYMKCYCLYKEDSIREAQDFQPEHYLTHLVTSSSSCCDNKMKARCHNLIGCCLTKQSQLNCAIQQFREALQQDFTYLEPLYNLSLVYRRQNLYDAELESLNLLVTALENIDSEASLAEHGQTSETVLGKTSGVGLISVLYSLAKRCLELKRYNVAAEKYLDLLSVLDETSVFSQASSGPSIPTAGDIYLEAAFALFKSGQYEESLLICDQIITKTTAPDIVVKLHEQDDSTELLLSVNKSHQMTQENMFKHPNASAKFEDSSSRTATVSRKRHREDTDSSGEQRSSNSSQRSSGMGEKRTVDRKSDSPKSKQLHLYCSALLLKSQYYRTVGEFSNIEVLVDRVLELLKDVDMTESVAATSKDCGKDDTVGSAPNECEPKLKKRKLNEGNVSTHYEHTSTSNQPIIDILLELKAQACSDKALILIGQANLQEAMKFLLKGLQYQPDDPTVLYNYAILLLKMGRRQDATAAISKYSKVETDVEKREAIRSVLSFRL